MLASQTLGFVALLHNEELKPTATLSSLVEQFTLDAAA